MLANGRREAQLRNPGRLYAWQRPRIPSLLGKDDRVRSRKVSRASAHTDGLNIHDFLFLYDPVHLITAKMATNFENTSYDLIWETIRTCRSLPSDFAREGPLLGLEIQIFDHC